MPHDEVTFGLALIGFALLALDAAQRLRAHRSASLTRVTAVVVVSHVACVWAFRFGGSLAAMLDKGVPAFLVFHGALAFLLIATFVREPWRTRAVVFAFVVVCCGAVPAPFRYPELALLRLPVLAIAIAAIAFAASGRRAPRRPA